MANWLPSRIVSGGQTGADRAALGWAIRHGISYGGWCPRGRIAEDGRIPLRYRLRETPTADFEERTLYNVRDSDGTAIFTIVPLMHGGTRRSADFCAQLGKPWIHVIATALTPPKAAMKLVRFLVTNRIRTLNIAGLRASLWAPVLSGNPASRRRAHEKARAGASTIRADK